MARAPDPLTKRPARRTVVRAAQRVPAPDTSKARPIPRRRPAPKVARRIPGDRGANVAAIPGISKAGQVRQPRRGERRPKPQGVSTHLLAHRIDRANQQLDREAASPVHGLRGQGTARVNGAPRPAGGRAGPGPSAAPANKVRGQGSTPARAPRTQAERTARDLGVTARTVLESLVRPLVVGQRQLQGQAKVNRPGVLEQAATLTPPGIIADTLAGRNTLDAGSALPQQLLRELEGTGALAGGADAAKKAIDHLLNQGPSLLNNPDPSHLTTMTEGIPETLNRGLVHDAFDLTSQAVPSVYLPLRDVAHGDIGAAVKKVAAPFEALASDPAGFAVEHPLATALMLRGGVSAVGRGAGATMRGVGRVGAETGNETLKSVGRLASTARPDAVVEGTEIRIPRAWSKDVIGKATQVLRARYGVRAVHRRELLRKADEADAAGAIDHARELRHDAARLDPSRATPKEIRTHVDSMVGAFEALRRMHRDQAIDKAHKAVHGVDETHRIKPGDSVRERARKRGLARADRLKRGLNRTEQKGLSVVAQGIARADPVDIAAYIDELKKVHDENPRMTGPMQAANRALRAQLQDVVDSGKVDYGRLLEAARGFGDVARPLENKLIEYKMLAERQAEKSRLTPAAARRFGASHATVDQKSAPRAAAAAADKEVRAAERELVAARRAHGEARAAASGAGKRGAVSAAREEGATRALARRDVNAADRRRLMARRDYRALVHKENNAGKLLQEARRVQRNAHNAPGLHSVEERAAADAKVRRLERTHKEARSARQAIEQDRARGNEPQGALSRLERARGAELEVNRTARRKAEAKIAQARKRRDEAVRRRDFAREKAKELRSEARRAKNYTGLVDSAGRPLTLLDLRAGRHGNTDVDVQRAEIHQRIAAAQHQVQRLEEGGLRVPADHPLRASVERLASLDDQLARESNGLQLQLDPAFLTQAPGTRGKGNFFTSWYPPKGIKGTVRSGEATRLGTFDASPEVLVEQMSRMQGLIDANENFTRFIDHVGMRGSDGKLVQADDFRGGAELARIAEHDTGIAWRPVRIAPLGGREAAMVEDLLQRTGREPDVTEVDGVRERLVDALQGKEGPGKWTIVPEVAADRVAEHLGKMGASGGIRAFRHLTSAFRKAVLSTNPRWLYGNVGEGLLRLSVQHGLNPVAVARSVHFIRQLGEEVRNDKQVKALRDENRHAEADALEAAGHAAWEELQAYGWGGGVYQAAGTHNVIHSRPEHFAEGTTLRKIANALEWTKGTPLGLFPRAWDWWTRKVFVQVNGSLERGIQQAMAGKVIRDRVRGQRDAELFSPTHMGRLQATAVEQAARGLRGTSEQIALGRAVMRAYGQYHSWSPTQRTIIENYTPFLAWTLNSFRFLTQVLPADHPMLTAVLSALYVSSDEWRKKHGLSWFAGKGQLPDFLQGTIPVGGGGHVNPGRYTPFGFGANPGQTLYGNVLPQVMGPILALAGRDWKLDKLKDAHGQDAGIEGRLLEAIGAGSGSSLPLVGQTERAVQRGDDVPSAILHEFAPLPVLKKKKDKKAAPAGGLNFGGASGSTKLNFGP